MINNNDSNIKCNFIEITQDIRVGVNIISIKKMISPKTTYNWVSQILIQNKRSETIRVSSQHINIIDEFGHINKIDTYDLNGEQPLLRDNNIFQYNLTLTVPTPTGILNGYFGAELLNNYKHLDISLPSISLDYPHHKKIIH